MLETATSTSWFLNPGFSFLGITARTQIFLWILLVEYDTRRGNCMPFTCSIWGPSLIFSEFWQGRQQNPESFEDLASKGLSFPRSRTEYPYWMTVFSLWYPLAPSCYPPGSPSLFPLHDSIQFGLNFVVHSFPIRQCRSSSPPEAFSCLNMANSPSPISVNIWMYAAPCTWTFPARWSARESAVQFKFPNVDISLSPFPSLGHRPYYLTRRTSACTLVQLFMMLQHNQSESRAWS